MTLLPIVDRELRVAARKRSTFWLRLAAASAALIIGSVILLLSLLSGKGVTQLGSGSFQVLTWLSFAAALGTGLFFTSDSLSEEKREGTLGLLFLTDLRGYDVVLGKLLATSLRGACALLAIFPVFAIALLLGGVSGGQFWRTLLAIVNGLFFSLALGLFVSALSRDGQRALAGTLGLLIVALAAGPLADRALAAVQGRAFTPLWSLTSPGYVFTQAGSTHGRFWPALVASQVCAWLLLAVACGVAPKCWQDKSSPASPTRLRWDQWWRYGGAKRRARLRTQLLDTNPALWLAARERWQAFAVWLLAATVMTAFGIVLFAVSDSFEEVWVAFGTLCGLLVLVLYLWVTSQACRFFVDARRSGLLELLLASPLDSRRIVEGAWRALVRSFGPPVIVVLIVQLATQALSQSVTFGALSTVAGAGQISVVLLVAVCVLTCFAALANLVALAWFGLWMGLTSKSAHLATIKALVFVQIIPSFVFNVATAFTIPLMMMPSLLGGRTGGTPTLLAWLPLIMPVIPAVLSLAKDVFFVRWSQKRLYGDFRERALQTSTQVRLPAAPPVIASSPRP